MGLLSTGISKGKRISIKEMKLPAHKKRNIDVEEVGVIKRPPSEDSLNYSKAISINPHVKELVSRLNLVSAKSGNELEVVEIIEPIKEAQIVVSKTPKKPTKLSLKELTKEVIERQNNYTKEEIIERIINITKVTKERAEQGFKLILDQNLIIEVLGYRYYLTDSTPF